MGKKNVAVNNWLSDNERFADLFNGSIFEGKQIIRPEELENMDRETYQALRSFLHSEKMLKEFTDSGKEVRIDMCQALEELYQDGVREGREEGVSLIVRNMLKNGVSVSDIKKYTGVEERVIAEAQKLMDVSRT